MPAPTLLRVKGDLLSQPVDAIVNPWNQNLIPHWLLVTQGLSGAIKRRTGRAPFDALRWGGRMRLGEARLTDAPNLPFRGLIHVAGINHLWRSSEFSVRESARNALRLAEQEGFESVAFPAIGAGSSLTIGHREFPLWGVTTQGSLAFIEDEARKSSFPGRVILVEYAKS